MTHIGKELGDHAQDWFAEIRSANVGLTADGVPVSRYGKYIQKALIVVYGVTYQAGLHHVSAELGTERPDPKYISEVDAAAIHHLNRQRVNHGRAETLREIERLAKVWGDGYPQNNTSS